MKANWTIAPISDVARVVNGGTPNTKVSKYWNGNHLWITPAEMSKRRSPYLGDSRRTLTDEGLQSSSATLVPTKSVILSTRAPIGHLVINKKPMAFNQGCRAIVPGESAHYKYLYYFLLGSIEKLNDLGSGTTFRELTARKLKSFKIPLPSLEEQKRIVAILDEAFAGIDTTIANTEKNLANAQEVFESYLNAIFAITASHYDTNRLDKICTFQGGSQPPKSTFVSEPKPGYVRLLQIRDFKDDTKAVYIPESRKNRLCTDDDILIGRYGASVGQIHMGKSGAYNVALIKASPDKSKLAPKYFYYFLLSRAFQVPLSRISSRSAQAGFSKNDIAPFVVPMPTLGEQRKIAARLDEIAEQAAALEATYEYKLTRLSQLKKSLLQKAFSGELAACDSEDEIQEAIA